ncbi:MAG: immunoglobulin domain-containing protein [Verrucomicrobia subdivision 3 bacterium]|nr:immunoglobulin domain-containing protein [Limisphaerales bacterium]
MNPFGKALHRVLWLAPAFLVPAIGAAATFTVVNTNNTGLGSLRQAIIDANDSPGHDVISFQIPGTKPYTIAPSSPLPAIVDPVTIDGATQTSFTGVPIIQLSGISAGPEANGLLILGGNSVVRYLVINRFQLSGIRIEGAGTNVVEANYLGTDVNGMNNAPNGEGGIYVFESPGNLIGGSTPSARNIISGANLAGIFLHNAGTTGNRVQGNYIGTDVSGTGRLGNTNGIVIADAPANLVGGTTAGERNIISANRDSGMVLLGAGATGNRIQGNYIGTDVTGAVALSNATDGVTIFGAVANVIGGADAGARNIISANGGYGVFVTAGARSNVVSGNYIGTSVSGSANRGNRFSGVGIFGASSNVIGGTSASARNIISGNRESGVFIGGTNVVGNVVQGNFIGTTVTGTAALSNLLDGVILTDFASNNIVGGTVPGAGNVISANLLSGVRLIDPGVRGNRVQGNLIGTDASGTADLGNGRMGVRLDAAANIIGGTSPGAGNVISGNGENGVYLFSAATSNNVVQGNLIGTDITGTMALANTLAGIGIENAPSNTIGGSISGARNVISGNRRMGIYLLGAGATRNAMQGNFIGTDITGTIALANGTALPIVDIAGGIDISSAPANLIGGTEAGAGNLISANLRDGIAIGDSGATGNVIQGNFIGTELDGVSPLGNEWNCIEIRTTGGATGTLIGGTESGAGNRLAFAQTGRAGIRIRTGTGNTGILIRGNSIFSNTALGIDVNTTAGVTANDSCDGDSGPNLQQNYPTLVSATAGSQTVIQGTLNSRASMTYLIQFYSSPACDPSGNGEGQTFLGETMVTTAGNCLANFNVTLPTPVPGGSVITATATDSANNTSEFSPCVTVVAPLTITSQPVSRTNTVGTTATFSVTVNGAGPLSYQWKKGTGNLSNGGNVSGATTANLVLSSVTQNDAANYSVVVSNPSGSVTSSTASLVVIARPTMSITRSGNSITLTWPGISAGFAAQQTTSLSPPIQWTAVTNPPALAGGNFSITLPTGSGNRFYRLVTP